MNPPDRAIVLCVVETSQVQALNRTQPILPLAPGVPARQSHDYERHGVTSLFAAMDVASGVTITSCYRRHRHQEFLRFLNDIDANLPCGFEVHLVMDNYGTHKVNEVLRWLARQPHYHVQNTPISGTWLNLVERMFAEVTERCVRRGSYTAVRSLEKAMLDYLHRRNKDRKPFVDGRRRSDLGQGRTTVQPCFRLRPQFGEGGNQMRRFIITGAPGAGKTAIIRQLELDGFSVVEEAATDVIAAAHAQGTVEPWRHPSFIDAIAHLQRNRQIRASYQPDEVQFHDRCTVCTAALAVHLGYPFSPFLASELERLKKEAIYQNRVFFIRNLGFITPTEARRISFEDGLRFEKIHQETYRSFGFELVSIEPRSLVERVNIIKAAIR